MGEENVEALRRDGIRECGIDYIPLAIDRPQLTEMKCMEECGHVHDGLLKGREFRDQKSILTLLWSANPASTK